MNRESIDPGFNLAKLKMILGVSLGIAPVAESDTEWSWVIDSDSIGYMMRKIRLHFRNECPVLTFVHGVGDFWTVYYNGEHQK